MTDPSPEERIVLGAIAAIEAEGIQNVTTRSIARYAGVNSAAINYYFRSKDRLMERVIDYTLNNAFGDIGEYIPAGPLHSLEPVKAYYRDILWGIREYPQISRAHLMGPIINEVAGDPSGRRLNDFLVFLFQKLTPMCLPDRHEELRRGLVLLQSALMMFGLSPTTYSQFLGTDEFSRDDMNIYVDQLVDRLIGSYIRNPTEV